MSRYVCFKIQVLNFLQIYITHFSEISETLDSSNRQEDAGEIRWGSERNLAIRPVAVACLFKTCSKLLQYRENGEKERVRAILRRVFELYNAQLAVRAGTTGASACGAAAEDQYSRYLLSKTVGNDSGTTEIDQYLASGVEPVCDVLDYWQRHQAVYPVLAKIARDSLAVCASSVDAERAFSISGTVVSGSRNRLSPSTVQKVMCLKSWYRVMSSFRLEQRTVVLE